MKHWVLFALASALIGNAEASSSVVGSWFGQNLGQSQSTIVATFLPNGEFFLFNQGNSLLDPGGQSGLEYGTYNWDSATGSFGATDSISTVGGWISAPDISSLSVVGNILSVNNGAATLNSIPNVDNSIFGNWYLENTGNIQGSAVVSFLPSGVFFLAEVGVTDAFGHSGIETGTFTWDSSTGAFVPTVTLDTNGGWGFSDSGQITVAVTGNQAQYTNSDGVFNVARIAPVPLPSAAWLFMSGLLAFFWRREKA
ncbi:PEP-CTERM sorting domain-containing protein [Methylomonas sp. 2BW1-5-20]|uniref:PEP-CTERM sorting domain-containing protein n=1 Tax=Methylomonas sp. 2BW1-5-20 TaxID=3376686 RepID=UPI00404D6300